jgi:hypothetical protein
MKTYKDINEFIVEVFPLEHRKIIRRRKSDTEEAIENADAQFDEKLEKIIKGEKES